MGNINNDSNKDENQTLYAIPIPESESEPIQNRELINNETEDVITDNKEDKSYDYYFWAKCLNLRKFIGNREIVGKIIESALIYF